VRVLVVVEAVGGHLCLSPLLQGGGGHGCLLLFMCHHCQLLMLCGSGDMECNHTLLKMRILTFLPINPCSST